MKRRFKMYHIFKGKKVKGFIDTYPGPHGLPETSVNDAIYFVGSTEGDPSNLGEFLFEQTVFNGDKQQYKVDFEPHGEKTVKDWLVRLQTLGYIRDWKSKDVTD